MTYTRDRVRARFELKDGIGLDPITFPLRPVFSFLHCSYPSLYSSPVPSRLDFFRSVSLYCT